MGINNRIIYAYWKLINFARLANLPEGLYILLALISSFCLFFTRRKAKLAQYLLDQFSRSFHQMEGICVNFLDQVHFFRFLKARCHGNQFCVVADLFGGSGSISGSAGPIFTIVAPYGKYWIADDQSDLLFPIFKGCCHVNQFCGKITYPLPLVALSFRNVIG